MLKRIKGLSLLMVMAGLLIPSLSYAQGEAAPESMTGLLNVGDTIPGFTLKDQEGADQSLKGLLAKEGTTVLVFYRSANW
jgi:hypothetical protein